MASKTLQASLALIKDSLLNVIIKHKLGKNAISSKAKIVMLWSWFLALGLQ